MSKEKMAAEALRKLRGRAMAGQGWSVEIPRKLAEASGAVLE